MKKLSTTNNLLSNDSTSTSSQVDETRFKEFNSLFMLNGKLKKEEELKEMETDQANCGLEMNHQRIDMPINDNLAAEYDELMNGLCTLSPSLPEVLTYKLSSNDSHICCADLRDDLRYCCAGTENSELLVFPIELKLNQDFNSKWISTEQEPSLIEEKQERAVNKPHYSFYGHHGSVTDLKFVPNSNYIMTCSNDTNSILWDLNQKEDNNGSYLQKKYYGHTQPVYSLDVNCLGTHFFSGSKDYTAKLFSLDRSNLLRSFVGHQNCINCVHFHPNSKYIATGSSDQSIRMWDISTSNMVRVFNCQTEIYSLCYSTDGHFLASAGSNDKIKIWDLTNGKLLIEFNSMHTRPVNSLSFNSSSTILISSSVDQQVHFWNFKAFKQQDARIETSVDPLLLNKNLLIKVRRAKFTHPDLLVAIGT